MEIFQEDGKWVVRRTPLKIVVRKMMALFGSCLRINGVMRSQPRDFFKGNFWIRLDTSRGLKGGGGGDRGSEIFSMSRTCL